MAFAAVWMKMEAMTLREIRHRTVAIRAWKGVGVAYMEKRWLTGTGCNWIGRLFIAQQRNSGG